MSENLDDKIEEAARNPKRVRTDAGEVEQHDLSKMVEVDKYLASKKGAANKYRGLRFTKMNPPGAN